MQAEELKKDLVIRPNAPYAVSATGTFQFDSVTPPDSSTGGRGHGMRDRAGAKDAKKAAKKAKAEAKERKKKGLPPIDETAKAAETKEEGVPFSLRDLNIQIPRGPSALATFVWYYADEEQGRWSALLDELELARRLCCPA